MPSLVEIVFGRPSAIRQVEMRCRSISALQTVAHTPPEVRNLHWKQEARGASTLIGPYPAGVHIRFGINVTPDSWNRQLEQRPASWTTECGMRRPGSV
jgi:hypothetical protein